MIIKVLQDYMMECLINLKDALCLTTNQMGCTCIRLGKVSEINRFKALIIDLKFHFYLVRRSKHEIKL